VPQVIIPAGSASIISELPFGGRMDSHRTVIAIRIAITLACLVGVPTVALVGIGAHHDARRERESKPLHRVPSTSETHPAAVGRGTEPRMHDAAPHWYEQQREARSSRPSATLLDARALDTDANNASDRPQAGGVRKATYDAAASPDRLTEQLQRLQALGATYSRLESSADATGYTFHCRIAGAERAFEAADPVASAAVDRVLQDVELWHDHHAAEKGLPPTVYRR
jgi:hypothetical protein